jgi:hypothetical protein
MNTEILRIIDSSRIGATQIYGNMAALKSSIMKQKTMETFFP